jgi:hypothetical protein
MAQQLAQCFGVGMTALAVHLSLLAHGRTAITAVDVGFGYYLIGAAALFSTITFYLLPAHAGAELNDR